MEIRGAGNLLGAKQSGFIDEIGFDMYTKLLEEAVAELKGDESARLPDTTFEYDGEAYLPIEYIDINQHKVDLYRRLAQARSVKEVEYLREEMTDRYGKPPVAAADLIEATMIKILAAKLGIEKVRIRAGRVALIYEAVKQLGRAEIERRCGDYARTVARLVHLNHETGSVSPRPHGGGNPALFAGEKLEQLRALVAEHSDATLEELRDMSGVSCSVVTVHNTLKRLKLPRKKSRSTRSNRTRLPAVPSALPGERKQAELIRTS